MNQMTNLENLISQGLPTRKTESWKYTNVNAFFEKEFNFFSQSKEFDVKSFRLEGFHNLFIINGELHPQSDKTNFELSPFSETIIKNNQHLLKDDFAYQLQQSQLTLGHHFYLKPNMVESKPIVIFHIEDDSDKSLRSYQTTIHLGENANAQILEVYLNTNNNDSLYTYASAIQLDKNAHLLHVHHQSLEHGTGYFNNICAQVDQNANYESFTTTLGGKLTRNNIAVELNHEGAKCLVHGVYTLQEKQHSDCNSFIHHKAAQTHSEQLYKGIMNDEARGVFTGLIKVAKDAQLITSSQLNKNLLLSAKAQANSRPQLEIFADDVKCSHGSTTGQLDEEELFYFLSRGIRVQKAYMMLARAFTYDVLLKIENPLIRQYIQNDITSKFEKIAFKGQNA